MLFIVIIIGLAAASFAFIALCSKVQEAYSMPVIYWIGGIVSLLLLIYLLIALLKPEIFQ